jgi:gluconolactonase
LGDDSDTRRKAQRALIDLDSVAVVAAGFNGAETVISDTRGWIYGGGKDGVIRRLAPDGVLSDFADTGGRPLGMAFDRDESLIVCDIEVEAVLRIGRSGEIGVHATHAGDLRLGFPNGAVFDDDGNLYISNSFDASLTSLALAATGPVTDEDRLIRLPNEKMAAEVRDKTPSGALCRIGPDGRSEVLTVGLYCPNGIAIDPDESAVFVLQSTVCNCLRVPLNDPGGAEVFCEFDSVPDGLVFDSAGVMIVTLPLINRLVTVDRGGEQTVLVDDPRATKLDLPTNCAFGGATFDDLYVGHVLADHLARFSYGTKGHPLYHQRL